LVSGQKPVVPTDGLFWKISVMEDCTLMVMVSCPELVCAVALDASRHSRLPIIRRAFIPPKLKLQFIVNEKTVTNCCDLATAHLISILAKLADRKSLVARSTICRGAWYIGLS
jgi:hypothetical protein